MQNILTASQMSKADQTAVNKYHISAEMLMENAGAGIANMLMPYLSKKQKIFILCGRGNNGGDGMVIGRYLKNHGFSVYVYLVPNPKELQSAAKKHYYIFKQHTYPIYTIDTLTPEKLQYADIIIDAMLGTGFKPPLKSPYQSLVKMINQSHKKVIAVDLPSGIQADFASAEDAVFAESTYMIASAKPSAFLYPAADHYGRQFTVDIGMPPEAMQPYAAAWTLTDIKQTFPKRPADVHKAHCGKYLIIGGSPRYLGAPVLTARAALTCGAGLITLGIPSAIKRMLLPSFPEFMYQECQEREGKLVDVNISSDFDAAAVGMGLSRYEEAASVLEKVMSVNIVKIIDADGLYYLSRHLSWLKKQTSPVILTPHEGEMARLMQCDAETVHQNRLEIAKEFAIKWGVYLVLKGPYSVIAAPNGEMRINTSGNAGLAKGGSGDLLSGVILSQIKTHRDLFTALSNAVFIHGYAADLLVSGNHDVLSVTPSSILQILPQVLRRIQN